MSSAVGSAAGRRLKVLIVDDEPLLTIGIADMLEDLGHRPVTAASGHEALALLAAHPDIDLLITDQAMPGMTGTDLARAAIGCNPALKVFLSTGFSDLEGLADRSLPRLKKPYSLADLEALIASTFGESAFKTTSCS
jgi:CheY-like chemotaxis protein